MKLGSYNKVAAFGVCTIHNFDLIFEHRKGGSWRWWYLVKDKTPPAQRHVSNCIVGCERGMFLTLYYIVCSFRSLAGTRHTKTWPFEAWIASVDWGSASPWLQQSLQFVLVNKFFCSTSKKFLISCPQFDSGVQDGPSCTAFWMMQETMLRFRKDTQNSKGPQHEATVQRIRGTRSALESERI